jgi:hypothetical protein
MILENIWRKKKKKSKYPAIQISWLLCMIRIILPSIIPLASPWTVIIWEMFVSLMYKKFPEEQILLTCTRIAYGTDTCHVAQVEVPSLTFLGTTTTCRSSNDPWSSAPNTSQFFPIFSTRSLPWGKEISNCSPKGEEGRVSWRNPHCWKHSLCRAFPHSSQNTSEVSAIPCIPS